MIYEVDYGYLEGTLSSDGEAIDIWIGSIENQKADAIICTIDLVKKDLEIKILKNCTDSEKRKIYEFHNKTSNMKGLLVERK